MPCLPASILDKGNRSTIVLLKRLPLSIFNSYPIYRTRSLFLPEAARGAAVEFELAPSLAAMLPGVLPTAEFVEAVPIAVEVALAAPEELVVFDPMAAVLAIVAVVSSGSVEAPAAELEQHVEREPCGHCEGVARCTTPGELPKQ